MNSAYPKLYLEDPVTLPSNLPMVQIAEDVAMNLENLEETILPKYGLTVQQFALLSNNPQFQMMLEEQVREWSHPKNVKERIRLKALMAVEDGLIDMHGILKNEDNAPQARVDAIKQLTTLADAAPKREAEVSGGPGFSITINLGDDPEKPTVAVEKDVTPPVIEVD